MARSKKDIERIKYKVLMRMSARKEDEDRRKEDRIAGVS
jgi:hypothetical protein